MEKLVVTEERQRRLHACCDIPHGFYGDRAYAQKFGYRMPILAGDSMVQTIIYATQVDELRDRFDTRSRMLRPVHWDDGLAIVGRRDDSGRLVEVRSIGPEGNDTNDLRVPN